MKCQSLTFEDDNSVRYTRTMHQNLRRQSNQTSLRTHVTDKKALCCECSWMLSNSSSVEISRSIRFHGFVFISSKSFERGQSLVLTHVQVRFGYLMRFSSSNSHAGTVWFWLEANCKIGNRKWIEPPYVGCYGFTHEHEFRLGNGKSRPRSEEQRLN